MLTLEIAGPALQRDRSLLGMASHKLDSASGSQNIAM